MKDATKPLTGKDTVDVAALETVMASLVEQRAGRVVVMVRRGIRTRYLEFEPAWGDGG